MDFTPSREDYLIAVYLLEKEKGTVRSVDVVELLGYTKPSVCNGMKRLRESGLLCMDEKKHLILTAEGRRKAESIHERYRTVHDFLVQVLGVPEDIAYQDTCKIEHLVSEETYGRMKVYMQGYNH